MKSLIKGYGREKWIGTAGLGNKHSICATMTQQELICTYIHKATLSNISILIINNEKVRTK
jgi:hypothetical protein